MIAPVSSSNGLHSFIMANNNWRQQFNKAKERAARDVTLPNGAVFKLRMIDPQMALLKGYALPQQLALKVQALIEADAERLALDVEAKPEWTHKITPDEAQQFLDYEEAVIKDGLIWPRLVGTVTDPDNEISMAELGDDPEMYHFIFRYCTGQVESAVIATEQGGATIKEVAGFRDSAGGDEVPGVRPGVSKVRGKAVAKGGHS